MKDKHFDNLVAAGVVAIPVVWLIAVIGVVYVAWHFIAKFW